MNVLKYTVHCNTIYISADYDLHLDVTSKSCTLKTNSEVQRTNVWSPSSLSVLISVLADPTVLWNPWQIPFPQQASSSELIPSLAQLSSQIGLLHVRFPQLESRAEKPVVTSLRMPHESVHECCKVPWFANYCQLAILFASHQSTMDTLTQNFSSTEAICSPCWKALLRDAFFYELFYFTQHFFS